MDNVSGFSRSFDDMVHMMTAAFGNARRGGPSSGTDDRDQVASELRDLVSFMTQVQLVSLNSSVRFMIRWLEASTEICPQLIQTLSAATGDPDQRAKAIAVMADHLRAYVRRMGEVPLQEAQRLQSELEAVIQRCTPSQPPTDTAASGDMDAYQRRWKTKE